MSRWQWRAFRVVPSVVLVLAVVLAIWLKSPASGRHSDGPAAGTSNHPRTESTAKPDAGRREGVLKSEVRAVESVPASRTSDAYVVATDLAKIETLAEAILVRRDAVAESEARFAEADAALAKTVLAHRDAKSQVDAAKAAWTLYKEETYPQALDKSKAELSEAKVNLKAAQDRQSYAKEMLRRGYFSEDRTNREGQWADQAKTRLEIAQRALETIEKTLFPKDREEFQAAIDLAEKDVSAKVAAWEESRAVRAAAERRVTEVALTAVEAQVIVRMDEVMKLCASGDITAARAACDEVASLWRGEESHRAALRSSSLNRRMRQAADEIRLKQAGH